MFFTGLTYFQAAANGEEAIGRLQPAAQASARLLVSTGDMERGISTYVETGKAESLAPYAEGASVGAQSLAQMRVYLAQSDASMMAQLEATASSRRMWITNVADPVIAAVRAGRRPLAKQLQVNPVSAARFEILRAHELELDNSIDNALQRQFTELGAAGRQLFLALAILAIILVGTAITIWWVMSRQVLRPLGKLQLQLQTVARGEHKQVPIVPSGPAELAAVGQDAEAMRRQLVHEIDEARSAREELAVEGPVVNAIHRALAPSGVPLQGVAVAGDQTYAQDLCGDWWDAVPLPDGRSAVIVADVSGHGWQAALKGILLKEDISTALRDGGGISDAIALAAQRFAVEYSLFATVAVVAIDPVEAKIEWLNAGHLPPFIQLSEGSLELGVTGPLLSTLGGQWSTETADLGPEDLLIMCTDGITESHDERGEQLDESGLSAFVRTATADEANGLPEVVAQVVALARARAVDWDRDDATLVAARLFR